MRQLGMLTGWACLALLVACTDASGDVDPANPYANTVVPADESAMTGRVVTQERAGFAGARVAACSDVDCPFSTADDEGFFLHDRMDPLPRRFEIFGQYDQFGSVVFRREFTGGQLVDVGEVVVSATTGPRAEWPKDTGGTVVIADGMLELTAGPDEIRWPLGTVDFDVQAAVVAVEDIPPYNEQPWVGREDGTVGFAIVPFDLLGKAPVEARVLTGVTKPAGTKYDVYHSDPLDGRLELAGTATVDADGVLATDEDCDLRDLTFILFVPRS